MSIATSTTHAIDGAPHGELLARDHSIAIARARGVVLAALACYLLSGALSTLGVALQYWLPITQKGREAWPILRTFQLAWDAGWYTGIAQQGYRFDPSGGHSSVQFYPIYPYTARLIARYTGWDPINVLLVLANVCFLASFGVLCLYLQLDRKSDARRYTAFGMLALAVCPFTFYHVMNFSEPMFLLAVLGAMYGIKAGWSPWGVAVVAGLAMGVRPTGLALLAPLTIYLWYCSPKWTSFAARAPLVLTIGCWGLIAFHAFQVYKFGTPWANFVAARAWESKGPFSLSEKLPVLLSLEPVWSRCANWRGFLEYEGCSPLFCSMVANLAFWLTSIGLVALGAWKRWLSVYESLAAAGMLAIPYVAKVMEIGVDSFGRYSSVVFPIYLVAAQLLSRLSLSVACAVLTAMATLHVVYAMLFANGYAFF